MRIAVLSTEGVGVGGAVRATRRLVAGLRMRGHDTRLISLLDQRAPDGIGIGSRAAEGPGQRLALAANHYLQRAYIDERRTPVSNSYFSAQVAGHSFRDCSILDHFDIVNIHWAARFLAPHTVAEIVRQGRHVVHTLHDMAAFTGGCHYSAGCSQYREQCSACPQLTSDVLGLTRWTLARKRQLIPPDQVSVISPSRWLAQCAVDSGVFGQERVFTIPNAVETEVFRPTEKRTAKALLSIDPDVRTLMFGADDNRENRKGFDLLMGAWERMRRDPHVAALLDEQRVRILVIGAGTEELRSAGVPLMNLGSVRNDSRLALIYSAADLLILPSREDNQPNILLEAMSCGTPVVAFAIGGIPDVIQDGADGRLIPPFDLDDMATAAAELLVREDKTIATGMAARRKIADRYHLDIQAAAYEELFARMQVRQPSRKPVGAPLSPDFPEYVALPVTLDPDVASHPIGLFLEQQSQLERLAQLNIKAEHEIERVKDVLEAATRELLTSHSWRYTRRLRRSRTDPEISMEATPEQAAVMLLNLFRSKSWEFAAPFRLLSRVLNLVRGLFGRLRRHRLSPNEPHVSDAPTLSFHPPARPSQRLDSPSLPDERGLNIICLHLYHLDLWDEFKTALAPLIGPDTPLYITLPESHVHFIESIYKEFDEPYCKVFILENRGLDIYPFLFLFNDLCSRGAKPLTLTKLHTKKSTHHNPEFAERWRKELYQSLLSNHRAITQQFHNSKLAMVCSKNWWVHEDETSENYRTEQRVIESACKLFGVSPTDHYLTGSMYMVSFDYLDKLFTGVDRENLLSRFQSGYQRSDTLAHGFERAICYGTEKFALEVGLL